MDIEIVASKDKRDILELSRQGCVSGNILDEKGGGRGGREGVMKRVL